MIRGALWLLQVVGETHTFTKSELREAFPGVSQIDRRIRDLRAYGWVVHSNSEDASLLAEDQRFVRMGVAVWDPQARQQAAPMKTLSNKQRQAVLARDGYMCTLCGITGGEAYPDDNVMTAVLAVSRRVLVTEAGGEEEVLVTECRRCKAGVGADAIPADDALNFARELDPTERDRLLGWMTRRRRGTTDLDRAWAAFTRVPEDSRQEVIDRLTAIQEQSPGSTSGQ